MAGAVAKQKQSMPVWPSSTVQECAALSDQMASEWRNYLTALAPGAFNSMIEYRIAKANRGPAGWKMCSPTCSCTPLIIAGISRSRCGRLGCSRPIPTSSTRYGKDLWSNVVRSDNAARSNQHMDSGAIRRVWLPLALSAVAMVYILRATSADHRPARWIGLGIALIGLAGVFLARYTLGRSFSVMAKARALVTTGIYSRIRNPIYVSGEILLIGVAIMLGRPCCCSWSR